MIPQPNQDQALLRSFLGNLARSCYWSSFIRPLVFLILTYQLRHHYPTAQSLAKKLLDQLELSHPPIPPPKPFTVEPVNIIYEHEFATSYQSPKIEPLVFATRQSYINSVTGLILTRKATIALLEKMGHRASIGTSADRLAINTSTSLVLQQASADDLLSVTVPPTRPDILHECDLVEDVAIAYGFNNLTKTFPSTNTVAKPYPINKISDLVRKECAFAGWPTTHTFFEVSDVVLKDPTLERKAKNLRRVAAVYVGKKSAGFEVVHDLLNRIMAILEIEWVGSVPNPSRKSSS
ncbi:hypothetical protein PTTG_09257 [Puccinia triticina 1-1 BBBD Race 1]|uniref:phenylalanine--tRNA ligase n=1 Tax=Puccinia triticina (isolate 1-1 / race 1 (BBBD)) TaxID=630390 RepID=A0A0C4F7X1_PUCT1|nr:hypothetical protein PTTG_09257 [Puccinia triticina 1-1 BBBD Race 1]